jgi:hypothetical protein
MGHYCLICLTMLIFEPVCCKSMLGYFRDLSFLEGFASRLVCAAGVQGYVMAENVL